MKNLILSVAVSIFAAGLAPTAFAATDAKGTPQQERMKACSKEAGEKALKGDERRKFMSVCLKG